MNSDTGRAAAATNEVTVVSAAAPLLFTNPGLGGIWQTSNSLSLSIDVLRLALAEEKDANYHLVVAVIAYLVLQLSRERHQRVNDNRVETALVHGIRTLNLYGSDETEVMDNVVRGASRYGIHHRAGLFMELQDPVCLKVHRNTILHAQDASAFRSIGLPWDFAALIWVESGELEGDPQKEGYGTTLLSLNHGEGSGLTSSGDAAGSAGGSAAVCVETSVASVTTNHILCNADYAFNIQTSRGLFTDNIANRGKTPADPAIDLGPNVIV